MFEGLRAYPPDEILSLIGLFRDDPRRDKIDLGVGVYRDTHGRTPVMRAVKTAEQVVWETQASKSYTGLAGDPAFAAALRDLVLGDSVPAERVAASATPGGTGAIRQALDLAMLATPGATVWLPEPTWPNHATMTAYLRLATVRYRYYDPATGGADFDAMTDDLDKARPGDVVVLHGCCHNPTGADLSVGQWQELGSSLERTGALPLIDLAYHGLGDGLDADAAGTRLLSAHLPEVLVAVSCSKTFGLYRDRAGLLLAIAPDGRARAKVQGGMAHVSRHTYSFPPDHGARIVTTILESPTLRAEWIAELDAMRGRMLGLRHQLSDELRRRTNSDRFDALARQRGMFSRLPASAGQVAALREGHGIYVVGDGRINIAGLTEASIPRLAAAIIETGI